jgi:hypothetical protein
MARGGEFSRFMDVLAQKKIDATFDTCHESMLDATLHWCHRTFFLMLCSCSYVPYLLIPFVFSDIADNLK